MSELRQRKGAKAAAAPHVAATSGDEDGAAAVPPAADPRRRGITSAPDALPNEESHRAGKVLKSAEEADEEEEEEEEEADDKYGYQESDEDEEVTEQQMLAMFKELSRLKKEAQRLRAVKAAVERGEEAGADGGGEAAPGGDDDDEEDDDDADEAGADDAGPGSGADDGEGPTRRLGERRRQLDIGGGQAYIPAHVRAEPEQDDCMILAAGFLGFMLLFVFGVVMPRFGIPHDLLMAAAMAVLMLFIVYVNFCPRRWCNRPDTSHLSPIETVTPRAVFLVAGCFGCLLGGVVGGAAQYAAWPRLF